MKPFKSLHNVVNVKNLLPQIKIFEYINNLLFLIQIQIFGEKIQEVLGSNHTEHPHQRQC